MSHVFAAMYDGTCSKCRRAIVAGQPIKGCPTARQLGGPLRCYPVNRAYGTSTTTNPRAGSISIDELIAMASSLKLDAVKAKADAAAATKVAADLAAEAADAAMAVADVAAAAAASAGNAAEGSGASSSRSDDNEDVDGVFVGRNPSKN